MGLKRIHSFFLFFLFPVLVWCCECPLSSLSMEECNKYELIFRGKIKSINEAKDKWGEAVFELSELYKGNATKEFNVLFDKNEACSQPLIEGQEWIIYSRYKQIDNAKIDWCSRSRKHFSNDKEDFYTVTYGNDYDDELSFLRQNLGLHRFLTTNENKSGNRNELPSVQQSIWIVVVSILALLLFYYLFNRFFK